MKNLVFRRRLIDLRINKFVCTVLFTIFFPTFLTVFFTVLHTSAAEASGTANTSPSRSVSREQNRHYEIYSKELTPALSGQLHRLVDEAFDLLPPRAREVLKSKSIRITTEVLPAGKWAKTHKEFPFQKESEIRDIVLSTQLVVALQGAPLTAEFQDAIKLYGNLNRFVLGALLHEMGHLYDFSQAFLPEESQQILASKKEQSRLRRKSTQAGGRRQRVSHTINAKCRDWIARKTVISDSLRYLALTGWKSKSTPKNQSDERLIDLYEIEDIYENFAVNFTFFLLDKDYACRKPALYQHFKEHFSWAPYPAHENCSPVFIRSGNGTYFELDVNRIYEIHYILAGKGTGMESRFGHSLLRFVLCKPGRNIGPDCVLDREEHVVIAFLGQVDDLRMNPIKGLFGDYTTILTAETFEHTLQDYTKQQLRSLKSFPLKLSRDEIRNIVNITAETFWAFKGKYYFLTRNCATEALDLLQGAIQSQDFLLDSATSPNDVLKTLVRHKIIDNAEASITYPSHQEKLEEQFQRLKESLINSAKILPSFEKFLYQSNSENRLALYKALLNQEQTHIELISKKLFHNGSQREALTEYLKIPSIFLYFENYIVSHSLSELERNKGRILMRFIDNNVTPDDKNFAKSFRETLADLKSLREKIRLRALPDSLSYGIPSKDEIAALNLAAVGFAEEEDAISLQLGLHLDKYFSDDVTRIEKEIESRNNFIAELKNMASSFKEKMSSND